MYIDEMTPDITATEQVNYQVRSPSNGHHHADIDIIDKCNMRCKTCWRGVGAQKNTSSIMPLQLFRKIVKKLHAEGFPNIALINWTEPFLCTTLHKYVSIVKEYGGIDCWLSSNLSLPPKHYSDTICSALSSGVDILFVTVSGFTQPVYEINHTGGNLEWIKSNLEIISQQIRLGKIKTSVWLRFLEFPYNIHEKDPWIEYAKSLGIGFDPVPAYGNPYDPLPPGNIFRTHVQNSLTSAGIIKMDETESANRPKEQSIPDKICELIGDRVAIDSKGDVYICCAYPNIPQLMIGRYLDLEQDELLFRRQQHPFCCICGIDSRRCTTTKERELFARAVQRTMNT